MHDLVRDEGWDHEQLVLLHQTLLGANMDTKADDMPFATASNLMVDLPADDAPKAESESLARDNMLSIKKFLVEATPGERKLVLGWLVDTR